MILAIIAGLVIGFFVGKILNAPEPDFSETLNEHW